ncbi:bifunctional nitrate reductase/sulfite reductase flavoprotein subunit alpha [Pseudomonas sp. RP23018S]|uniref:bifunctional nitrate reductase/sulfite reductase flavoprotein subunit alpha n=1 Tax=Pseudomonas sp. RP23018S TaxID=3096037 RepID=UPI002ACA55BE|nr:bifunctional nitrate reductase/sulfite reductase flavoprotein subunit alpha [Pseudomonas sp. RP23018S]MDZ5601819.1 bifunctional nitrate reductase/sulfite reductase flavoprotein subunit alpha [Pseudomonas sp. RP23018S]
MNQTLEPSKTVRSVCPYCGVGCGIVMQVENNLIVKVSGDKQHPSNAGRLCTKGSTCAVPVADSGRMTHAFVREARSHDPVRVGIEPAIEATARRLRAIIDEHGADAFALYVSGQMSLEAQYLANKLTKGFIRSRHIESNSRLCMASAGSGYKLSLGADGPPGAYDDLDHSDVFLVIGANMADCHPVLFLRLLERVRAGAKLIVVDPRRTGTADKADLYLQIAPGTDLALLNGLLHLLVRNGHTDPAFIADFTEGWEVMEHFLETYTPTYVAQVTGLAEADIRQCAQWIGEAANWMSCWTMGLNQSVQGTWHTNALCNLHLATGAICRTGSGPFSLTGQPNAMGGREMGYMGPGLPGQRSALVAEDRAFIEQLWGMPADSLRSDGGQGTVALFQAMAAGSIKACWIICTNPVASVPNRQQVIDGLRAAELVIAQDAFLDTETNRYADILLPGALWAEAEGVMINSERNLTLTQQAVQPPGEALPDWQLIARVACAMGYAEAFSYASAAEVFEEIKRTANPKTGYDLRGASHARLRQQPLQWPCAAADGPVRNPIRYGSSAAPGEHAALTFPTASGKAQFFARPHLPPAELPDELFPLVLNTGRVQHQWHTLTKTGKVPTLNKLNPGPFIEVHAEDAERLGLKPSQPVQVRSRRGVAVLPALISDRVRPGHCFAPFHWNDVFGEGLAVNAVTSDAIDPTSLQPAFKYSAVALQAAPGTEPETAGPAELGVASGVLQAVASCAGQTEASGGDAARAFAPTQIDSVARLLNLNDAPPLVLNADEQLYLQGYLLGLRNAQGPQAGVPTLPEQAPFDPQRRVLLNGMLAGVFSRTGDLLPTAAGSVLAPSAEWLVLWGSQTGNGETLAGLCAQRLSSAGQRTRVQAMDTVELQQLRSAAGVLLVTSTFGDGDPPDNAVDFWHTLSQAEPQTLTDSRFGVLALGDSSYQQFCGFGRRLDERLAALGAERLQPRLDCEPDYEGPAEQWLVELCAKLASDGGSGSGADGASSAGSAGNAGGGSSASTANGAGNACGTRSASTANGVGSASGISSASTASDLTYTLEAASPGEPLSTSSASPERNPYTRAQPLRTTLLSNRLLNAEGAEKETRHLAFDLNGHHFPYHAGDALGVWPVNAPGLVDEVLAAMGLDGDSPVALDQQPPMPLRRALTEHLEIARINPNLLRRVAELNGSATLRSLLEEDQHAALQTWLWGRQLPALLREFPVALSAQEWLQLLKPLQPRLYSISSSPALTPNEVHLTVATVRFTHQGVARGGVCSTFLADMAGEHGVRLFLQPCAHFRPPQNPDTPLIMIGPGTGIAPFRGFLQERQAQGAGRNWLFFGEQRARTDFYYRQELRDWQRNGVLQRLDTAFSRDQDVKVYVQQRMLEAGAEIWAWLEQGAHVCVCGDAARMAKDVDAALKAIVQRHGKMSSAAATLYVSELSKARRYLRDVY